MTRPPSRRWPWGEAEAGVEEAQPWQQYLLYPGHQTCSSSHTSRFARSRWTERCLCSRDPWSTWSAVGSLTSRAGELRSARSMRIFLSFWIRRLQGRHACLWRLLHGSHPAFFKGLLRRASGLRPPTRRCSRSRPLVCSRALRYPSSSSPRPQIRNRYLAATATWKMTGLESRNRYLAERGGAA